MAHLHIFVCMDHGPVFTEKLIDNRGFSDRASFEYTEGISADETLFARSLAHSITEDVCREKGVSVEKVAQLKKQVEEGTYEPDPMAIARAMYNL